jgi:hypothetical protein
MKLPILDRLESTKKEFKNVSGFLGNLLGRPNLLTL